MGVGDRFSFGERERRPLFRVDVVVCISIDASSVALFKRNVSENATMDALHRRWLVAAKTVAHSTSEAMRASVLGSTTSTASFIHGNLQET